MATTIVTKNSSTASAVPTAAQLVQGELAVNVADKRLYTEDNAGAIVELGTNPSTIDINSGTIDGTAIGASSASTGAFTTLSATGEITANGGIALGDSDVATFGDGDDLQIYHDGSNSYIKEVGTGNFYIRAANNIFVQGATANESIATFQENGAVILYNDNAQKLATTSTGIDVTGTVVADALTLDSTDNTITFGDANTSIRGASATGGVLQTKGYNGFSFTQTKSGDKTRFNIADGGDISFYEDTGTTAKLFWDASAESLGIGTSSPATLMEMASTSPVLRITNTTDSAWSAGDDIGRLSFYSTDSSAVGAHETAFILNESDFGSGVTQLSGALSFGTAAYNAAAVERMRIDSSGNVGIGCSPSYPFEVQSGGVGTVLRAGTASVSIDPVGSASAPSLIFNGDANTGFWRPASDTLAVSTAGVERLRIDASGNLLVGKTADNNAVAGVALSGSGIVKVARTDWSLLLNRLTTDGDIALFQKDGATVGSIGTTSGRLFVGNGDVGLRFAGDLDFIAPWDATTNAARDNAISLGNSGNRFKDLYLSGGVYQSGTRLIKRTATSSGGSTIFASITDAPQTGFIHIYEIGTTNYAILACTKRDTSSDVVTTVVANNVLTVNATNAGGTVAVTGHTTTGNVRMQATIIREA
jgi:hypothetical protein